MAKRNHRHNPQRHHFALEQQHRSQNTIIYLKNLAIPRLGQEPDESILQDLQFAGDLVLVLDYQNDPKSISPNLNADMLKLRQDIGGKTKSLLTDYKIDLNHVFILLEGFRLERDIKFARDGSRILAMDVQYPSRPSHPVPMLMEITCDNANRMGISSLLFCHDTLLDGGMAAGFRRRHYRSPRRGALQRNR